MFQKAGTKGVTAQRTEQRHLQAPQLFWKVFLVSLLFHFKLEAKDCICVVTLLPKWKVLT